LHIANGDTLNDKLKKKENIVGNLMSSGMSDEQLIEEACLTSLSRLPTDAEKKRFAKILKETAAEERRLAVEDLFWALLSSREFLFNH
jgi:ferritin-like metal-binding protein YciE